MFTDILDKYMNIFIIILYVYILYSYDFKKNTHLLLLITGLFIYIIYKNKGKTFTNDIIEGQTDGDGTDTTGGDGTDTTGGEDTTRRAGIIDDSNISRLRSALRELEAEISSLEDGAIPENTNVNELINLYLELNPDIEFGLPSDSGNQPFNLNLDLESINIPSDIIDTYNENELPKLKKRLLYLEKKVQELDKEDHVQMLKEKVMDLEIENDKWNQKGIEESEDPEKSLKQRKTRSFSNYKTTTAMGMYDGMCLDHLKKENIYDLADEADVNTFLGTTLPLKVRNADNSKLNGPSVDGNDNSPKRLNMFETNKTSISCCEDSPYLSSNGCVCLTSDQEDYLVNRGGNHD